MKILRALAGCAALTFLYCSSLHAGTFNAFGPQTYVRNTATPVTLTNSFSILNPNTQYTLNIQNSGAASAVIAINGTQILGPGDFSDATAINRPVTLRLNNTIAVQLRSASGTSLKVTIIGVDNDLPVITASAAPTADTFGWNNTNVVVKFTCSDKTSGVAFCPPAVTVSTEAANQVITGTAADRAGNTASASVTLNIDKTVPVISAVAVPPANTFGWNNATAVTVTFNCLDPLSGIATCTPPAILNAEGANQIAAGTAVDKAGNMASASAIINIDRIPPTIAAQATPAPNAAGWNNTGVNVAFTCADSLSGIASCPPPATVNSEGANQSISGTALDKAGNSASAAVVLNIDETPPTVTATPVPAANSAGWNNTNVTINFNCSDTLSGVDFCPAQTIATTEGANQVFSGTARDRAGNTSTASAALNIDKTPPSLKITAPLSGATVIVPTVTLEGLVTDTLSGVAGVTCNGTPAQVSGSALTCGVPLSVGLNTISVVATDAAGNATTSSLTINFSATPTITITSPLNLSVVNATPVVVTGTVSDPNATVNVNGTAVPLTSGNFSVPIILKEGGNTITVVAQSAGGTPATATISVSLDTTPPHVTIDSPADGTITTASTIAVSGMINDIVPGTVNAQQATVTVNGMPAQVLNRNYLLHAVPLSPGPNTVTALGTDLAGNTASVSITVVQKAVISQPTINLVSGDGQTGTIGTLVASPLIVQLKDGTGNPVAGQPVVFKVTGSNGTLSGTAIAGNNGGPTLVVNSDANGLAQVTWTLGMRAGAGNNMVKATAANFVGEVNFGAITLPATPGLISVDSGNNQFGAVGQPLPHPFVLVVTDTGHNRLPNIPVTFTVQQGGGFFSSQGSQVPLPGQTNFTSIIVKTDSDGRAMAILTLGQQEGIQNNLVEANFAGNQGFPATFTASGRVAGDPAATSISGVALDNTNIPIAGVTIQVENTALTTQSDPQGQFLLTGVPVGRVKLIADGATAARPGTWPKLEYELVTVSGTNNTLGMPVYLLPLDLPHGLQVDDTHGGTLTLPDVPGFALTIAPGSVTFPDGGKSGLVSVTVVHADKVPMTPNFGQQPRFIVSIQPAGAHFNPPAAMTLPNVDGLSPGEVTEMYSFDHDLGSFVAIGTGTVSKDGSVIKSDPGVGIVKGGWHCGGNPSTTGSAHNCGTCETCITNTCVPNAPGSNCGPCWSGGSCQNGSCAGGTPLPAGTSCGSCSGGGVCDGNGACIGSGANPNGSSCGLCVAGGACQNGQCIGGTPLPAGTSCNANACQTGATCDQSGNCSGGVTVLCNTGSPCAGQQTCDPATGACVQQPGTVPPPPGSTCDICTSGATCNQNGTCTGGTPDPLGTPCGGCFINGLCDGSGSCLAAVPVQNGSSCGSCYTGNGSCVNGACIGGTQVANGTACGTGGSCQNGACVQLGLQWRKANPVFSLPTTLIIHQGTNSQNFYDSSYLFASATPVGGTFTWTSNQPSIIQVTPDPSNPGVAQIIGLDVGAATITVTYSFSGTQTANPPTASINVKSIYPIVMVHGFNSGTDAWDPLSMELQSLGLIAGDFNCTSKSTADPADVDFCAIDFCDECLPNLLGVISLPGICQQVNHTCPYSGLVGAWGSFSSFIAEGAVLGTIITNLKQTTGAAKVTLLAHSMGGLASRAYLQSGATDVANLITIGTPNLGTPLADLATDPTLEFTVSRLAFNLLRLHPDSPAVQGMSPAVATSAISQLNSPASVSHLPATTRYISLVGDATVVDATIASAAWTALLTADCALDPIGDVCLDLSERSPGIYAFLFSGDLIVSIASQDLDNVPGAPAPCSDLIDGVVHAPKLSVASPFETSVTDVFLSALNLGTRITNCAISP